MSLFKSSEYPLVILGANNNLDFVTNENQIKHTSKLAAKNKILRGARIYTISGQCYHVLDIAVLKQLSPWWKFEFFNPIVEIDISMEAKHEPLEETKSKITSSIRQFEDYWNDREEIVTITDSVNNAGSMPEIITYLKRLRGI